MCHIQRDKIRGVGKNPTVSVCNGILVPCRTFLFSFFNQSGVVGGSIPACSRQICTLSAAMGFVFIFWIFGTQLSCPNYGPDPRVLSLILCKSLVYQQDSRKKSFHSRQGGYKFFSLAHWRRLQFNSYLWWAGKTSIRFEGGLHMP